MLVDRHGRERRRGVVAGDGVDGRVAEVVVGEQRAELGAGLDERAEEALRQPEPPISSRAQSPLRASSRPVVEAFVRSLASSPHSHSASRSGISAIRCAASSAAEPSSASSWKTVLIGIVWMPVGGVEPLGRHALEGALDHPVGAVVAVVEGEAEDAVLAVEQRVVDAPGVDADARELARAAQALRASR